MTQLSRHPTTRYQAIAASLEQQLSQYYQRGDYLPSEQKLAAQFAVNRHTLRRAVDELVARGLVQRRPGVGILVLMRPWNYPLHAGARFSQNLLEQGSHPTCECLMAQLTPATDEIALALNCAPPQPIIHLRTLRRVNQQPLCVIDHYLAEPDWWPSLRRFSAGSLHDWLSRELNVRLRRWQTRIAGRRARPAEARLLETAPQAPLLCVRTLNTFNGSDRVAEYSVSLARADLLELTLEH